MTQPLSHQAQIKRLERSSTSRVLSGVSGGLGTYFDLNPAVFRLGFVVLTLLGGAGILVYLAALLVMPDEGSEHSIATKALAERRDRPWPLVGLGLIGVAILVLVSRGDIWPSAGAGWVLILIGGAIVLWTARGSNRSRGKRIAIALGIFVFALLAAVAAAISVAFAWFDVSLSDGVGDRVYQPSTAAAVKPSYETGIGNLRIDLSAIDPSTVAHVDAHVGIGHLKVIVPRDAKIAVDAHAEAGALFVLDQKDDGEDATVRIGDGTLTIHARIGGGRIDVERAR